MHIRSFGVHQRYMYSEIPRKPFCHATGGVSTAVCGRGPDRIYRVVSILLIRSRMKELNFGGSLDRACARKFQKVCVCDVFIPVLLVACFITNETSCQDVSKDIFQTLGRRFWQETARRLLTWKGGGFRFHRKCVSCRHTVFTSPKGAQAGHSGSRTAHRSLKRSTWRLAIPAGVAACPAAP